MHQHIRVGCIVIGGENDRLRWRTLKFANQSKSCQSVMRPFLDEGFALLR
jgi:hypothetical protein